MLIIRATDVLRPRYLCASANDFAVYKYTNKRAKNIKFTRLFFTASASIFAVYRKYTKQWADFPISNHKKKDACRSKHPYTAEGPDGAMATAIIHIGKTIRSCLDFISALVERTFCVGFFSRGAANSGLFARIEREKMPKRISNKPKSISLNISAIKSKTASKTPPPVSALPEA